MVYRVAPKASRVLGSHCVHKPCIVNTNYNLQTWLIIAVQANGYHEQ